MTEVGQPKPDQHDELDAVIDGVLADLVASRKGVDLKASVLQRIRATDDVASVGRTPSSARPELVEERALRAGFRPGVANPAGWPNWVRVCFAGGAVAAALVIGVRMWLLAPAEEPDPATPQALVASPRPDSRAPAVTSEPSDMSDASVLALRQRSGQASAAHRPSVRSRLARPRPMNTSVAAQMAEIAGLIDPLDVPELQIQELGIGALAVEDLGIAPLEVEPLDIDRPWGQQP